MRERGGRERGGRGEGGDKQTQLLYADPHGIARDEIKKNPVILHKNFQL